MTLTIGFYVDSVPFTRGVIDGSVSLGGSESACLGLARALKARGHDVHIVATKLDEACEWADHAGVVWHPAEQFPALNQFIEWDVFVVLRMFPVFAGPPIRARLRLLWNQDLLTQPKALMGSMWAVDAMVYVSEYQRRQYEDRLHELARVPAFVTKNGFDRTLVPSGVTKHPHRIIHISRPERGLRPLLQMWPAIRKADPQAELRICRYSSMYDAHGWGRICAQYDQAVAEVQAQVGGVTWLGELGKPNLYQEIATSAVMWYPGVHDFAETSCIAAIESQACGTPFVGSYKGALPETVPSGVLVKGNADSPEYQQASTAAVLDLLKGCASSSFAYRQVQQAGRKHVQSYTYDAIAGEWDAWLAQTFRERYAANRLGILRQFLHDDDHVAAKIVADDIMRTDGIWCRGGSELNAAAVQPPGVDEAEAAAEFCDKVIAGQDQVAEHYAHFALDPATEVKHEQETQGRMARVVPLFEGCTHVLDVACGNGAMAILLAQAYPELRVTGIDYAEGNITAARHAAEALGLADRLTFVCAPFWSLQTQQPATLDAQDAKALLRQLLSDDVRETAFDGAFCGEFLEHVAACDRFADYLETFLAPGAKVVFTTPHGPFTELLAHDHPVHKGHVHQFCHDDLDTVFGAKADLRLEFLPIGVSPRGADLGHWIIQYRTGGGPTRPRPLAHRIQTCRPLQRLSVGLIVGPRELDLRRCLDSVRGIADEIVIGDCGLEPAALQIAAEYRARVVPVGKVMDQPDGFSGARNAVLEACTGEWFLWIDADERLTGGVSLRKYLDGPQYVGVSLHQNHLMLDAQAHYDTPIRVFRRQPDIRFYGCVHEQPQLGEANGDIQPALEISDVAIAHTGYLIEPTRRTKMLGRNLPLLKRDQQRFPERRLGRLLWLRDFVNIADYEREQAEGEMTPKVRQLLRQAVALFEKEFADPSDKYHDLARPWYERALKDLGLGVEIEFALAGRRGGLEKHQHAKPRRIWIRQHGDLTRLMQHELNAIRSAMAGEPLKTDPFENPPVESPALLAADAAHEATHGAQAG